MKKQQKKSAPTPAATPTKRRKIPASFWTDRAAKIAASRKANEKAGMTERQRRAQRKAEREALAAGKHAPKKGAAAAASSPGKRVQGLADAALPESARPKGTPALARRGRTQSPQRDAARTTPPPLSIPPPSSTPDRDETIVVTGRPAGARRPRKRAEASA